MLLAFTADEETAVESAAALDGSAVSTFCREQAYEAALRILKRAK